MEPRYRRVIVKIGGEALAGPDGAGVHQPSVDRVAADLVAARALGISIGVINGGGNLFRGVEVSARGVDRATGDCGNRGFQETCFVDRISVNRHLNVELIRDF